MNGIPREVSFRVVFAGDTQHVAYANANTTCRSITPVVPRKIMNETNPYSAPQTDVYANRPIMEKLQGLDFKQLKKLYHRSCNVNAIAFLLGLGLIFLVIASLLPTTEYEPFMRFFFVGLAVFYAVAVVGLYKRTSWGRILGIIVCIISLISIPIGTAIGAFGLFAFFGAPELFGANRVTHRELKAEFKCQKASIKKG